MTRYFAQNTPRAGLEHMMMSVPGFQKRGGGMMILSRFCYKPEDVDCRYCLHYRRRSCQVRTCPYIAERLKSGAIEYLDLILNISDTSLMPACTRGFRLWNTGAGRIRQSCTQCPSTSVAALRTGFGMMRLLAIWRRSIFSPQRSDSGNRRSPLFHTIPLISAASYPNPMDLRYRITPSFIPPDGCMT